MDRVALHFISDPHLQVLMYAENIYAMDGAVFIEVNREGTDVRGFPFHTLASFHITKEYQDET